MHISVDLQSRMTVTDKVGDMNGRVRVEIHDAETGQLKSRDIIKNLYVTTGMSAIARGLVQAPVGDSKDGQITYCAVGTGNAAPIAADIKLQSELYRKEISIRTTNGPVAVFKTFFNQNEANGNLREIGLFGDNAAGANPDTGTLFARTNINRTKSVNDTLTFTWLIYVGGPFALWGSTEVDWDDPDVAWGAS